MVSQLAPTPTRESPKGRRTALCYVYRNLIFVFVHLPLTTVMHGMSTPPSATTWPVCLNPSLRSKYCRQSPRDAAQLIFAHVSLLLAQYFEKQRRKEALVLAESPPTADIVIALLSIKY